MGLGNSAARKILLPIYFMSFSFLPKDKEERIEKL